MEKTRFSIERALDGARAYFWPNFFLFFFSSNKCIPIVKAYEALTCSLNKRQTIRTMAREVLMSHMAHVGLPQAQFAQKYF